MLPDGSPLSAPAAPPVLSVSALNLAVARMLERNFPLSWIGGEISNFTRAASGHWYFTLKDEAAQVRAVMFKGRAQYAGFVPREGDGVEVRALVTLYAARGEFQLSVEAIRHAGVGNLYEAFVRLKEKLAAEGLFEAANKLPLPAFARSVGIVTSPQAAALRDVLTTLQRRAPHVRIVLYPTPVQGAGAAEKIRAAIGLAAARAECDVLLLCRGGGSIEDLWSFNDEGVARAIVACPIPVICGVGHETDFTIADFAADLRAPTPTAAAEMAVLPHSDWLARLKHHADELAYEWQRQLAERMQTLDWHARRLQSPATYIRHERSRLQNLQTRLTQVNRHRLAQAGLALNHLRLRIGAHLPDTGPQRLALATAASRLNRQIQTRLAQQHQTLQALGTQLELLDPQRTLERGYAIISDGRGHVIRRPNEIQPRTVVTVRMAKGSAEVGIASVQPSLE
jgi:exodeoxyribonuclease VII large subunit